MTCLFALQQLQVEPSVAYVGEDVVISVLQDSGTAAETPVELEWPDGNKAIIGQTGSDGRLRYTIAQPGRHVFTATVGGVRCLRPIVCHDARRRWMFALASVPLGLALLFVQLRRGSRSRDPV